jgi:hypothetical protein
MCHSDTGDFSFPQYRLPDYDGKMSVFKDKGHSPLPKSAKLSYIDLVVKKNTGKPGPHEYKPKHKLTTPKSDIMAGLYMSDRKTEITQFIQEQKGKSVGPAQYKANYHPFHKVNGFYDGADRLTFAAEIINHEKETQAPAPGKYALPDLVSIFT